MPRLRRRVTMTAAAAAAAAALTFGSCSATRFPGKGLGRSDCGSVWALQRRCKFLAGAVPGVPHCERRGLSRCSAGTHSGSTTACMSGDGGAYAHVPQWKKRRRSRPTWGRLSDHNILGLAVRSPGMHTSNVHPGGAASSGGNMADVKAPTVAIPHATAGARSASPLIASAPPRLPPLTHDQLPDESIYIMDGTAMLFRAYYGRGAGGYLAADGATEVGAVLAMGIEFAQFINEIPASIDPLPDNLKVQTPVVLPVPYLIDVAATKL